MLGEKIVIVLKSIFKDLQWRTLWREGAIHQNLLVNYLSKDPTVSLNLWPTYLKQRIRPHGCKLKKGSKASLAQRVMSLNPDKCMKPLFKWSSAMAVALLDTKQCSCSSQWSVFFCFLVELGSPSRTLLRFITIHLQRHRHRRRRRRRRRRHRRRNAPSCSLF